MVLAPNKEVSQTTELCYKWVPKQMRNDPLREVVIVPAVAVRLL
jgi:hypothetical protein